MELYDDFLEGKYKHPNKQFLSSKIAIGTSLPYILVFPNFTSLTVLFTSKISL